MNNIQIRPIPHMLKYRKNQFNSKKEVQEKPNPNGLHREAVNLNKFPKFVVPPLIRPSAAAAVRARGHASQGGAPGPFSRSSSPWRTSQWASRSWRGAARTSLHQSAPLCRRRRSLARSPWQGRSRLTPAPTTAAINSSIPSLSCTRGHSQRIAAKDPHKRTQPQR
jgi:hypothetical protein